MIYGNVIGGAGQAKSYILVDEDGNEVPAVLVDSETVFDATPNDIRVGKVAATETGVTIGELEIPAYHTTEGVKFVPAGSEFTIELPNGRHQYTKLQAIICAYNTSLIDSVSAEKVSIDGNVYPTMASDVLSVVTVDDENGAINLGITNESSEPRVIRYITYREGP